jgi:hypothetical protein
MTSKNHQTIISSIIDKTVQASELIDVRALLKVKIKKVTNPNQKPYFLIAWEVSFI